MEEEQSEVFLSMDNDYLTNKKIDYVGYAATKFVGYGKTDSRNSQRVFEKSEFINFLRTEVGMKKNKSYDCFNALVDINLIQKQSDGTYIVDKETAPFLKLYKDTVRYFFDHYKPIHFKVYCYLLNKYNMHQRYKHNENYFFSCAELLRAIGYNDRYFNNVKLMNEVLIDLENNHFISYNHETVGRKGSHGRYKELYWVNAIAENSISAAEETIVSDNILPQVYNGQRYLDYSKDMFSNLDLLRILAAQPQNKEALEYAVNHGDVPQEYLKVINK